MAKRICDPTSGKVGNQVYQSSRNGQVVRTRAIPTNPRSNAQRAARASLTTQARAWGGLTDPQRAAWTATAATVRSKTRLGMSGALTGSQLFIKINTGLALVGEPSVDTPPPVPSIEANPASELKITNTGGSIALKIEHGTFDEAFLLIRAAAPVSPGVARMPGVAVIHTTAPTAAGTLDITASYVARYGTPPVGRRVFVSVNCCKDGYQDIPLTFSALVPTAA